MFLLSTVVDAAHTRHEATARSSDKAFVKIFTSNFVNQCANSRQRPRSILIFWTVGKKSADFVVTYIRKLGGSQPLARSIDPLLHYHCVELPIRRHAWAATPAIEHSHSYAK